jgi:hypothetical protein
MHPSRELPSTPTTVALLLIAVTLWLLLRGYHGLTGDGQIYAFQALARIHTFLAADLYLQNTSQDQFTVFSGLYAWFIQWLGLEHAARWLTMLFTFWLLAAAWSAACAVSGRDAAWLAVAFLLIVDGGYGASGVFRISEPFLTARLPAEALAITALACYLNDMKLLGIVISAANLFVHPLIALPGLLLLISLWVSNRTMVVGAIAGLLATLVIAGAAVFLPSVGRFFPLMDSAWLSVVQERSQFLFLPLWSFRDWDLNSRPFLYLAFTLIALPDPRIHKLCMAAALVGIAGLGMALVSSIVGPVALLVQGQAWRWVWIPVFVSALLLPAVVLRVWQDSKCGPLCALLLVCGWTLSAVNGTACISLAIVAWAMRAAISVRFAIYLRWVAAGLGATVAVWISVQSSNIVTAALQASDHTLGALQLREIFGLKIFAALFAALAWWCARFSRSTWVPVSLSVMLLVLSVSTLPAAFKQSHTLGEDAEIAVFSDWRDAIPMTSTVLVAPPMDVGAFVWFTLQRPNYLALDQSAGAVFSRANAIEITRRSEVLLPVTDPDWKILSNLRAGAEAKRKVYTVTRPLTATSLTQICTDPQLGFVISRQNVGFESLRHAAAGPFKDWNLYDCRRLRPVPSST